MNPHITAVPLCSTNLLEQWKDISLVVFEARSITLDFVSAVHPSSVLPLLRYASVSSLVFLSSVLFHWPLSKLWSSPQFSHASFPLSVLQISHGCTLPSFFTASQTKIVSCLPWAFAQPYLFIAYNRELRSASKFLLFFWMHWEACHTISATSSTCHLRPKLWSLGDHKNNFSPVSVEMFRTSCFVCETEEFPGRKRFMNMMPSCIIYIRHVDLCQVQFYNEVESINDHRFVTVFDCHPDRNVAGAGLCNFFKHNSRSWVYCILSCV